MSISFPDLAELMRVFLIRPGRPQRHDIAVVQQQLHAAAQIVSSSVQRFGVVPRPAGPVLPRDSTSEEAVTAFASIPERPRTRHPPLVFSHIGPSVAVEVSALLQMSAAQQGSTPLFRQATCEEKHAIGCAQGGTVQQEIMNNAVCGTTRNQIDHASHRACSVERGRIALDHFHLSQVHGRNLQQPKPAALLSKQGETIGEEASVAPPHSLNAHTGRSQ